MEMDVLLEAALLPSWRNPGNYNSTALVRILEMDGNRAGNTAIPIIGRTPSITKAPHRQALKKSNSDCTA
jgi:hypothetical protein